MLLVRSRHRRDVPEGGDRADVLEYRQGFMSRLLVARTLSKGIVVGATEIMIVVGLVLGVGFLWGLIDICIRPSSAFQAAGQNKTLWLVGIFAAWVVALGWLVGWVYVIAIRPKVIRAQAAAESSTKVTD